MSAPSDGARGDARKRLAANAPFTLSELAALEASARHDAHALMVERNALRDSLPRLIGDAQAGAWDEGYARGVRDELSDVERADNPYRVEPEVGR